MLRKHGVVGKFVEFYGDGRGRGAVGQPRHPGQHEPRIRFHRSDFPDRPRDHRVPEVHRPQAGAAGAGRGLRQRAGHVARPRARAGVLRIPRARPVRRGAVDRRTEASAGPNRVVGRQVHVPRADSQLRRRRPGQEGLLETGRGGRRDLPGQRPGAAVERPRRRPPSGAVGRRAREGPGEQPGDGDSPTNSANSCSTTARW